MAKVTISAYELVCALGAGKRDVLQGLLAKRCAIVPPQGLPLPPFLPLGQVTIPLPPLSPAQDSRNNRLLLACARLLRKELDSLMLRHDPVRVGAVLGTSTSGMAGSEAAYPLAPPSYDYLGQHSFGCMADLIRALTGLRGPAFVVSTACSSGANALASARCLIRAGLCDAVIAGACDSLCLTTYHGFQSLNLLSPAPCRPFSQRRDGMSLGEGAALFLLEAGPPGPGLTLRGVGATSDAYHMASPDPEGRGAQRAMAAALQDAHLTPDDIDYINLHGTATPQNDLAEARAVHELFPHSPPCSSTKGYTGHALGAASAIEAALCLLAMEHAFLPASLNLHPRDVPLNLLEDHRHGQDVRHVLSNSFAFGGNNVSLLFSRGDGH